MAAEACSSSSAWRRSSSFWLASSAVASRTSHFQLLGRELQLLVQLVSFDRLRAIVQDRDDRGQLADLGQHLRGERLDRHELVPYSDR